MQETKTNIPTFLECKFDCKPINDLWFHNFFFFHTQLPSLTPRGIYILQLVSFSVFHFTEKCLKVLSSYLVGNYLHPLILGAKCQFLF